jgi:hypothetical protein
MTWPEAGVSVKGEPDRFKVTVVPVTEVVPAVVHPLNVPSGKRLRLLEP